MKPIEIDLFNHLTRAHLDQGNALTVRGTFIVKDDHIGTFLARGEKGDITGQWKTANDAIGHIHHSLKRAGKTIDDVAFIPGKDSDYGVTWRSLKYDMSYLRIVLLDDGSAMESILHRLLNILEKSITNNLEDDIDAQAKRN